jgi:hypothetical protein
MFIIVHTCAYVKQKIGNVFMGALRMRTLFTGLAFLVILLAVIPAVKRSLPAGQRSAATLPPQTDDCGKSPTV